MTVALLLVPLSFALADWYAVARGDKRLEYVFKPATLVTVILWAFLLAQTRPAGWGWLTPLFLAGLIFSLAGDVLLMLPDEQRFFVPGLASFLLAHVCYIVGLAPTLPPLLSLVLLVPVVVVGAMLFRAVAGELRSGGEPGLLPPVAIYSVVLSLMPFSAWATLFRAEWSAAARLLAVAGGTLFFASDAMLAWDRFVRPSPRSHLHVMITYHLAQFSLTALVAQAP